MTPGAEVPVEDTSKRGGPLRLGMVQMRPCCLLPLPVTAPHHHHNTQPAAAFCSCPTYSMDHILYGVTTELVAGKALNCLSDQIFGLSLSWNDFIFKLQLQLYDDIKVQYPTFLKLHLSLFWIKVESWPAND